MLRRLATNIDLIEGADMTVSTGLGATSLPLLKIAAKIIVSAQYPSLDELESPISYKHVSKDQRNQRIIQLYNEGFTLESLAELFDLSVARVHQIIVRWN